MFFKLLGAALVLIATTMTGFHFAKKLSERTAQLRELQMGLQMLETEIYYGSTPLEVALLKISQQTKGIIGKIFERCALYLKKLDGAGTADCWERAWQELAPRLSLKKEEQEWLHHFGHIIGASDREDQQKHIKLLMAHLYKTEQDAKDEQSKNEKMYKTLGVLFGLVIVILML